LRDVRERGGIAAIVSKEYRGPDENLTLLPVDDVLMSLQALARYFLKTREVKVVGITGSMGKTTTKDFAACLLEGKFRIGKTYSSYNTKLTLPITVLNTNGDEEILVLEMGMGEPGDIAKLVEIAPPDVAVLTKVGLAHYGALFPTVADIARAKGEIFSHAKTKKAIFYHGFSEVPINCEKVTFALEDREADYVFTGDFVDERGVRAYRFDLPFTQPHVRYNFLCAVAVARAFGMEWDEINRQVPKLTLPKMRFEQIEKEGILFINGAYNANPESTMAALSCLPDPKPGGKRIAVLGRMVDLGPFSISSHEEVGRFAQDRIDHLLTLADEAIPLSKAFAEGRKPAEHFQDLAPLTERLKELIRPGDVVLLKGSRDLQMERILL
jgi:UDP-N-acetylmuramoyl-tripeptide--D-alanyl-D-alanine ligase